MESSGIITSNDNYLNHNRNYFLLNGKNRKKDEFYTLYENIEEELSHYKELFNNKIVYCNCDNPYHSNFIRYFVVNFNKLHLKKLISTCYSDAYATNKQLSFLIEEEKKDNNDIPIKSVITRVSEDLIQDKDNFDIDKIFKLEGNEICQLKKDGNFSSVECIEILKESDIVVTNPPFSLFRKFMSVLMKYNKKFLILCNFNAIGWKDFFPLIKEEKIWVGYHFGGMDFILSDNYKNESNWYSENKKTSDNKQLMNVSSITWFTNLGEPRYKKNEFIPLVKKYTEEEYPKFDDFDAINVDKTKDIPKDYDGFMGVPISFMDRYNSDQFEIVGILSGGASSCFHFGLPNVKGKTKFIRILIKRK